MTITPLWLQVQRGEITEAEWDETRERRRRTFVEYQDASIPAMVAYIVLNYFDSPEQVMETPDRELLALRGVGQKNLATLRALFPNRHPHPPGCPKAGKWVYCPYCGTPL